MKRGRGKDRESKGGSERVSEKEGKRESKADFHAISSEPHFDSKVQ